MSPSKTAQVPVVERAIALLKAEQEANGYPRLAEKDLQSAMAVSAQQLVDQGLLQSCSKNFRAPIPGWWPAPGDVDFVIESKQFVDRRWSLFELKWCNREKLEEALWDIVKLACAHSNPQVRETHLVYAAPVAMWENNGAAKDCFSAGRKSSEQLLKSHAAAWKWNLAGGSGRPQVVPQELRVQRTGEYSLDAGGQEFRIKTVKVTPEGTGKLKLSSGLPFEGSRRKRKAQPADVVEFNASKSVKIRNAVECPICQARKGKTCRSLDDDRTLGNRVHHGRLKATPPSALREAAGPMRTTPGSNKRSRAQYRTGKRD